MSSSVGLRRGTVEVVPYRIEWQQEFAAERRRLHENLAKFSVDIEHVGSTAVEQSFAKPIIDIAIAVRAGSRMADLADGLEASGYAFEADAGSDGGFFYVKCTLDKVVTHHIHVVEQHDPQWRNYLAFRDGLRRDSQLRDAYSELKIRLGKQYPDDRESYTAAKNEFILAALANA